MAGLVLKEYQRESLEVIGRFCDAVRQSVMAKSMRPVHDAYWELTGRNFVQVPQLPNVPYVCLRVPTGGGKTLIAAHAVGTIARHLGHQDRPLCLWVTPSTTIRDQTLRGLRDREHPYHAALRDSLNVPVEVLRMDEALAASKSLLSSSAVIIVTTIQSYRIDNQDNRKIYEDNGYLMNNFTGLPQWLRSQIAEPETGRVALSLANVMKLRGPIVIMDEAHNARTRISFDSLARFGPLAVLELTATPQQEYDPDKGQYGSNVLHAVSALQLTNEGMIKLPIELESRENWLDVLVATKQRRDALEQRSREWGRESGRFIRPIALIQAQPKSKKRETHTVEVIEKALLEQLQVPAECIRIATGEHDSLGDEDLRSPDCKVEYVITVEKLRQGWDCPFAYVLGSVGNVATETAVEQLLGRIMRMPEAIPTGVQELDRAYAIVQSPDVVQTASKLRDSLIKRCGFDNQSVADAFRVHKHVEEWRLPVAAIPVSAPVDVGQLPPIIRDKVRYDAGSKTLHVQKPLTRDETVALRDSLPDLTDQAAVEVYWQSKRGVGTAAKALDQYAVPVRVPQLIVKDGERIYLFEPKELDEFSWNLDQCDPKLSASDFSIELNVGDHVAVGVNDRGGVSIGGVEEVIVRQGYLVCLEEDWSKKDLVRYLDNELHRGGTLAGLLKSESDPWLVRVVDHLLTERGADLSILVRKRYDLADVVIRRIAAHGRQQVRAAARMLIDGRSPRRLETSMDVASVLDEQDYGPYHHYRGPFDFPGHAFTSIGEMNEEEAQCAKHIDDHRNVKRWVRNLAYERAGGVSLPLSPGRFFPDFIVELRDGRLAIVEYKGAHLANNPDELYKKTVGELWAERSGGKCVFGWIVDKNWPDLADTLGAQQ